MAQHDYSLANQTGLEFRADLNNALQAIVTDNSGATAPSTTFPGMVWRDTSVSPSILKKRSDDNTTWVIVQTPVGEGVMGASSASVARAAISAQEVLVSGSSIKTVNGQSILGSGNLSAGYDTFRNKIINGDMRIDQRNYGASQTFTAGAALAYCVDRWYGYCTGANVSGQRIALSNGQNRYQFTGAASNTGVGFGQRIESANSMDLAGLAATLSVKLSSSSLTSITWTAFRANTTDAFGTLASPTRTQIATGTFTINSTEATYSATFSVPAAATTGIEIVFTGGALLGTQTLTIGDVQLEVGSVATPFEHRPYGVELALCQRYYEVGVSGTPTVNGALFSSGARGALVNRFAVQKRVAPSLTFTDLAGNANRFSNFYGSTHNQSVTSGGFANGADGVFGFTTDIYASGSGLSDFKFNWTASAEL